MNTILSSLPELVALLLGVALLLVRARQTKVNEELNVFAEEAKPAQTRETMSIREVPSAVNFSGEHTR